MAGGTTRYYIEALQAEKDGGDHVQVRWQLPVSGTQQIIPGTQVARWYPVSVWVEAARATVSEAGGQTNAFTIHQSGATDAVTVNIKRDDGTATEGSGSDFTYSPDLSGNTIEIPAGQTSVVIAVTPVNDITPEGDETVIVKVLPDGYAIGSPDTATLTIVDNDMPGQFDLLTPEDGKIEVNQASSIYLDWEDPSPPASSYTLVVADNQYFASPYAVEQTSLPATSSYTINGGVLSQNKTYYWKVTAVNAAGEEEASNNPFSFKTLDTIDPAVASSIPRDGAGGVDVSTTVRVYFDEPMKSGGSVDGTLTVLDSAGDPVVGHTSLVGSALIFTPEGDLEHEETYAVTLNPAGLTDLAGNALQDGMQFSFTTFKDLAGFGKGEGCAPGGAALGLAGAVLVAAAAVFAAILTARARRTRTTPPDEEPRGRGR
jgi:hypothetical protein